MRVVFWVFLMLWAVPTLALAAQREVGSGQTHATIQACLDVAAAGDICNVHTGTYTEQLTFPTDGTSGNRITLKRNGSDVVTVQHSSSPVIALAGKDYLTLDGLNVTYTGSGSNPVGINNTFGTNIDWVIIQNLTITMQGGTGNNGHCLYIGSGDHVTLDGVTCHITATDGGGIDGFELLANSNLVVRNSTVYGNTGVGSLDDGIVVSGSDILIHNNTIHDGSAANPAHPDGIVFQGGGDRFNAQSARITVTANTVYNFSQGMTSDPIGADSILDVLIANNVVYQDPSYTYDGGNMSGIVCEGVRVGTPPNGVLGVRVYNNTIDVRGPQLRVLRTETGTTIDIQNNLFLNPPYSALMVQVVTGVTTDYNYFDSAGDAQAINWGAVAYTLAGFVAATANEDNGVSGAPALGASYHPTAASDTRARGATLTSSFTDDRAGVTRTIPWDAGAYQYVAPTGVMRGSKGLGLF